MLADASHANTHALAAGTQLPLSMSHHNGAMINVIELITIVRLTSDIARQVKPDDELTVQQLA